LNPAHWTDVVSVIAAPEGRWPHPAFAMNATTSLLTGAGWLDLGCEAATFQTVAAVEKDRVPPGDPQEERRDVPPAPDPRLWWKSVLSVGVEGLLAAAGLLHGVAAVGGWNRLATSDARRQPIATEPQAAALIGA